MFFTNALGSLQIGRRALQAQQTVLATIGHNLSNVATPGYARQRAELEPAVQERGVEVTAIRRIRDRFIDHALLGEQQALGRAEARDGLLKRLEGIFNDTSGSGLAGALDQFFQGFADLSAAPADDTVRATVKDRAERVAATFQALRARVDQLERDLGTEVDQRVTEANRILGEIADLHRQIVAARADAAPNDLLDRRDRLVEDLAGIIGVSPTDRDNGTVQLAVTGTGVLLMDGMTEAPLRVTYDAGTDTLELRAGTVAVPITPSRGALAAVLDARNSAAGPVKQTLADLDALAGSLVAEVNRVHARGAGLVGFTALSAASAVSSDAVPLGGAGLAFTPGTGAFRVVVHDAAGAVASSVTVAVSEATTLEDVRAALDADPSLAAAVDGGRLVVRSAPGTTFAFAGDTSDALLALGLNTLFTGSDARGIALNPVVAQDGRRIAAARADAAGLVHPGDGDNALALAGLARARVMSGDTATLTGFYGTVVGRIGSEAREAEETHGRQSAALEVVRNLQQQASGVSMDEELISLTQSQNAYAAAARYVTAIQEVLEALLRMG